MVNEAGEVLMESSAGIHGTPNSRSELHEGDVMGFNRVPGCVDLHEFSRVTRRCIHDVNERVRPAPDELACLHRRGLVSTLIQSSRVLGNAAVK